MFMLLSEQRTAYICAAHYKWPDFADNFFSICKENNCIKLSRREYAMKLYIQEKEWWIL